MLDPNGAGLVAASANGTITAGLESQFRTADSCRSRTNPYCSKKALSERSCQRNQLGSKVDDGCQPFAHPAPSSSHRPTRPSGRLFVPARREKRIVQALRRLSRQVLDVRQCAAETVVRPYPRQSPCGCGLDPSGVADVYRSRRDPSLRVRISPSSRSYMLASPTPFGADGTEQYGANSPFRHGNRDACGQVNAPLIESMPLRLALLAAARPFVVSFFSVRHGVRR